MEIEIICMYISERKRISEFLRKFKFLIGSCYSCFVNPKAIFIFIKRPRRNFYRKTIIRTLGKYHVFAYSLVLETFGTGLKYWIKNLLSVKI